MRAFTTALVLLLALPVAAQTRGSCPAGVARGVLDDGDITAGLYTNGNLFFGTFSADYVVESASSRSPLYAADLWVGGTVGGEVRVAAASYSAFAFRPGPLNADGTVPSPTDCSAWDRIYVVRATDVAAYEAGGPPTPDLAEWPVALGADVVDGDGVAGNYNLAGGDRPRLVGTQTAFWVMNDLATPARGASNFPQAPIGVEVQVTAAAFASADPTFAQATLYRFRLIKRTPGTLVNGRAGFFLDPDLGDASDDYVGSDPGRGMGFAYNADDNDAGGFGTAPPAIGFDLLSGAGAITYFTNGAGPTADPRSDQEHYNVLLGLWKDGTPMTEGGTGYNGGGAVTTYAFPGDPVAGAFWSERNTNGAGATNPPGDRRFVVAAPALTLEPGVPVDLVLAIPYARGATHLDSVTRLRAASDAIQTAYDDNTLFPVAAESTVPTLSALRLSAPRPNPAAGRAEVTLTIPTAGAVRVVVFDVLGREVALVHAGEIAAGEAVLRLPSGLAPGIYTVVAESAEGRATQRLTVSF